MYSEVSSKNDLIIFVDMILSNIIASEDKSLAISSPSSLKSAASASPEVGVEKMCFFYEEHIKNI